jgi:glycosyltransferase involved in cell wall biosynthesis
MHVGLVIYGRLETLTGGYLYDRFLVEALRGRGHRVEVISLAPKPYALCLLDNLSRGAAVLPSGRRWDLLLQDALCHPSLVGSNRRRRAGRRAALVAIVHQVLCRQPRRRLLQHAYAWMERSYLRTLDGLLFTSHFNKDAARPLIGRNVPVQVAPPAGNRLGRIASRHSILERSRRVGPLELLFVGNLSPVKGLDPLLESLSRLPPGMWRLTVAGSLETDARHVRRIRTSIFSRGLGAHVRLLGAVDGERLRALYTAAQVLVMPFAHEGFGIAALEAMAFGLPVIGSTEGGVKEFVRHAQNGYLVRPRDHGSVRRHLRGLQADRSLLAAMGQAALETFSERPTWALSMRRACEFLEQASQARP